MPDDQVEIKKESSNMLGCCSDGEHYPYGTSISLEDEMIDKLGVAALAVEDKVEIRGYAFVDSKSEHSNKDESSRSIRFQLTSLKISRKSDDDNVSKLYPGE